MLRHVCVDLFNFIDCMIYFCIPFSISFTIFYPFEQENFLDWQHQKNWTKRVRFEVLCQEYSLIASRVHKIYHYLQLKKKYSVPLSIICGCNDTGNHQQNYYFFSIFFFFFSNFRVWYSSHDLLSTNYISNVKSSMI